MAGIDRPDAGTITIGGTELGQLGHRKLRRFRSRHIGFLFQDPAANLLSYMTVRDHLRMAARIRRVEPSETLLSDLEIGGLAAELPVRLSAGQQQRAALAAALIGNPDVILADEPTAELDTESAHLAVTTLRRARDLGATLVVTSHDPEVIDAADHVIYLEHGAIR
jgi:putative ABC transport system ATP-binding protein